MTAGMGRAAGDEPADFRAALASLTRASLRPEIAVEEMPAPQRIAPYAAAISADVTVDGEEVGTGRLILLHDPHGSDLWGGASFRFVAYSRTEVELEMVNDPVFGEVVWSWLEEALREHGAGYGAESGSVTRVATEAFGSMDDEETTAHVEIRAAWSPEGTDADPVDFAAHVEAWGELLCTAAGLPPLPEGVAVLPRRPATGPGTGS